MRKSLIREKSYLFALAIIRLYKEMIAMNEYVLSRQLVKAGTSIGANVEERWPDRAGLTSSRRCR